MRTVEEVAVSPEKEQELKLLFQLLDDVKLPTPFSYPEAVTLAKRLYDKEEST